MFIQIYWTKAGQFLYPAVTSQIVDYIQKEFQFIVF